MKEQRGTPSLDVGAIIPTFDYEAVKRVMVERNRQIEKWGHPRRHSIFMWATILGEEFGESCQAAVNAYRGDNDLEHFKHELAQIAAVAIATITDIEVQEREASKKNQ